MPTNQPPVLLSASWIGSGTPQAGDPLLLSFSENVSASGSLLDAADATLSNSGSLGSVSAAPAVVAARTLSITLASGVSFVPGITTITFTAAQDAIVDGAGLAAITNAAIVIGDGDGSAPVLSNVTIAAVDDALNGTGTAGGVLQVPSNGWTIDLTYSDNVGVDTALTQITANVAVTANGASKSAGTNLVPFLTSVSVGAAAASYRVPSNMVFPNGAVTLTGTVIDTGGASSAPVSFAATVRAFSDALRPFETTVNAAQVWFLDFTRDIESLTVSAIAGGASVTSTPGSNSRSDFLDVLHALGLQHTTPLPNVTPGNDSNQVVRAQFDFQLLLQLAALYGGAPISFTLIEPSPSANFGSGSVSYANAAYSRISVAGTPTTAGVLGVAIYDPHNTTQNDNTLVDFQGTRLGIFLQTIADVGLGPPASSLFRQTFTPFVSTLGGVPIGGNAQDGQRLTGSLTDARATQIATAISGMARFTALIIAHECGHSVGLVANGAMPLGLYGDDSVNFPGSADGHIRNTAQFPSGAINVMSPSVSYDTAIHVSTKFNSLNLAYLREQAFYGN